MKKKKTAKIYGLKVMLLPMDIIMKKDSEVEKRGHVFKCVVNGGQIRSGAPGR